ncbi:MAG: SpoIIE family protein phosphatase [Phycisphaerales bacterium]|nr:SpoIIE family protein phosphatase [Phycisphaerales bacterium]
MQTAINFITGQAPPGAHRRWVDPILARWPGTRPRMESWPVERVLKEWSESAKAGVRGPALVVLGPGVPPVTLYQLVDLLHRALVPGVILLPSPGPEAAALRGSGVLVEPWDADPEFLATVLFTLAERQPVVGSLSRELGLAMRQHGGFQGEITRMHDELNLAAAIQSELLPKSLPQPRTLDLGVVFRPVGYVSGDIYDAAQLDDDHLGFFIADAVGHGVPAALMTMVISRSLGMTRVDGGRRTILDPCEAMSRLNAELLRGRRQSPRFGTAAYGVVNTRTHEVRVCGAGHPQPLLVRAGGGVERIETDGPLLGVFPDEEFGQVTLTLRRGETLVLYSDGLETAFSPPDQEPGLRRVGRHVAEVGELAWLDPSRGRTLPQAIEDLSGLLDQQAGSLHQVDDITVLALGARGEPAERTPRALARAA